MNKLNLLWSNESKLNFRLHRSCKITIFKISLSSYHANFAWFIIVFILVRNPFWFIAVSMSGTNGNFRSSKLDDYNTLPYSLLFHSLFLTENQKGKHTLFTASITFVVIFILEAIIIIIVNTFTVFVFWTQPKPP